MRTLQPIGAEEAAALWDDFTAEMDGDLSPARERLAPIFDLSPFLFDLACKHPRTLAGCLVEDGGSGFDTVFDAIMAEDVPPDLPESQVMAALRRLKARAALVCGVADLLKVWDTMTVTRRLADFADRAVQVALAHAAHGLAARGKLNAGVETGIAVVAMGKHGAHELNYSSDIDVVVLFDPHDPLFPDPLEALDAAVRATRAMVRILQERTRDGYVFRTDLRLRPDPGSMPLALPVDMAAIYYETRGQNWERAAWIKARHCAGDPAVSGELLDVLVPFKWRRHLDFAAIADIHSIKRQIQAHHDIEGLSVPGHNVKLGRGGIREIEFFVQTQQLIAGGRTPALRGRETLPMLRALADEGWITRETADELTESYLLLRDVEHRVQMVRDAQAHTLPDEPDELLRIARMCGQEREPFEAELLAHLQRTERHYAELFEHEAALSAGGNLSFTGEDPDPGTLDTLSAMGFERPADMAAIVRGWHRGRVQAMQSTVARERLTAVTPDLLAAVGATGRPDETLLAFDAFLQGLPRGIQLFSLLDAQPKLLDLLLLVLGAAPRMARIVQRRPHVFASLIEPQFFGALPDRAALEEELAATLSVALDYEGLLDRARIFAAEQRFLVGVRLLGRAITPDEAGRAYALLAEVLLAAMLERVTTRFAERHGRVAGGRICVVAMGRLGSRELNAASDLDLIFLYEGEGESDGAKPLPAAQYHLKLVQALITAMSAATGEGTVYELDFRLRPSGNSGPLATSLAGFRAHQGERAKVWEHLALTRARPVAGDARLMAEAAETVSQIVARPRDRAAVAEEVADMRALMDEERPARDVFDVKLAQGGLVDLEFMAQFALLVGLVPPAMHAAPIPDTLAALPRGEALADSYRAMTAVLQLVRLCLDGPFDPEDAPRGLVERMLAETDQPDVARLEAWLGKTQREVRAQFRALVGEPRSNRARGRPVNGHEPDVL